MIRYVTKQEMQERTGERNYFGYAFPSDHLAIVRINLPTLVRRSVEAHELYHINDEGFYDKLVLEREWDAVVHQFKQEPLGTLLLMVMTLHPNRILLVLKRIFKGF